MANPEHLAKLKEGVEQWNKWRKDCPQIEPDLSGSDLAQLHLRAANLSFSNLNKAKLEQANLDNANLSGASLNNAPKKFVIYRWRTSPELLAALRSEARRSNISLDTLLNRITTLELRKRRAERKSAKNNASAI